jgi:hypothetical protein
MFGNLSIFWKFSYVLQRFEGILLDFVEFNDVGSAETDEMAVLRADGKFLDVFDSKVAFG